MPDPLLIWDAASGRYRDTASGRFLSRAAVRREVDASLANVVKLTDTLADDLRAGRISLNQWREEMRDVIKAAQMGPSAIAAGGYDQMTQADFGRVGQRIRREYQYLEQWVEQIKGGLPIDNRMESRSRQYIRSGRTTFLALESQDMAERGFWARNVTRAGEHCAECLAEEAKGLVPVNQLKPIGQRQCLGNCNCFYVWEKVA
jgi:hypothetical protein